MEKCVGMCGVDASCAQVTPLEYIKLVHVGQHLPKCCHCQARFVFQASFPSPYDTYIPTCIHTHIHEYAHIDTCMVLGEKGGFCIVTSMRMFSADGRAAWK